MHSVRRSISAQIHCTYRWTDKKKKRTERDGWAEMWNEDRCCTWASSSSGVPRGVDTITRDTNVCVFVCVSHLHIKKLHLNKRDTLTVTGHPSNTKKCSSSSRFYSIIIKPENKLAAVRRVQVCIIPYSGWSPSDARRIDCFIVHKLFMMKTWDFDVFAFKSQVKSSSSRLSGLSVGFTETDSDCGFDLTN